MIKMYLSMEFNFFWKNLQSYNFEWKIARNRSRVDEKAKRKNVREKIAHALRLRVSIERKKTDPTLSYITHAYVRSSREDETTRLKTQHRVTQWFLNSTFSMNPFVY